MANYRVWLHEDVYFGQTRDISVQVHKRFGLVLQHLMAHGRTGVVKGCRGANRGWRRSPLGGTHGKQYYLWWAPQDSPPCAEIPFPPDGRYIVIRDVRHHDMHDALDIGEVHSLHSFSPQDLKYDLQGAEEHAGEPLEEEQKQCIYDRNSVRLLMGYPGSGKTMTLWNDVEKRTNDSILFLTWSTALARQARERFNTFSDVPINVRNFSSMLDEIGRAAFDKPRDQESFAWFVDAIDHLPPHLLGPWTQQRYALYAEIRAVLLGRAIREKHKRQVCSLHLHRLSDEAYLKLREDQIGRNAADALLHVARVLPDDYWEIIFPDLVAATIALDKLRQNGVPDQWTAFDHIVVDEVQDLTVLEITVVMELRQAIMRRSEREPSLLLAGDEGQIVRPSGFRWDDMGTLIGEYLSASKEDFRLQHSLRCPQQIAAIVGRTTQWYKKLPKDYRPSKQYEQYETNADEALNAQTYYVEVTQQHEAGKLFDEAKSMENLQIISLTRDVHSWVPDEHRDLVWPPEGTKGLEYQHVCILNPGFFLHQLDADIQAGSESPELKFRVCRTDIDRLRVALSRSTEALTFVDFAPSDDERRLSQELLGHVAAFKVDEWIEHCKDDTPIDQKIWVWVDQARALIDDEPERAWLRARQAIDLLGDPDLPNGVQDEATRREAQDTALEIAARFLVECLPDAFSLEEVQQTIEKLLPTPDDPSAQAFDKLQAWSSDKDQPPFALLDAALALPKEAPLIEALRLAPQRFLQLMENYATNASKADHFAGDVTGWLDRIGFTGHATNKAWSLRCQAMDALLRDSNAKMADEVLHKVEPSYWRQTAQFCEDKGHWRKAVDLFERVEADKDALRVKKKIAQDLCEAGRGCLDVKQMEQALKHFNDAMVWDPENTEALRVKKKTAQDLCELGRGCLDAKQTALAVEHFCQAIDWDPENAEAFFQRGQIFAGEPGGSDRLYAMVLRDLSKACNLKSNFVEALIAREMTHRRLGQFNEAQADLKRIVHLNPERARACYREGLAYTGANPEGSIRRDSPALVLNPHLVDAYVELAHAFHKEDREKAKQTKNASTASALRSDRNGP